MTRIVQAPVYPDLSVEVAAILASKENRVAKRARLRAVHEALSAADRASYQWAHDLTMATAWDAARAGWLHQAVYWLARALWQEITAAYGRVELCVKFARWERTL